MESRWEEEGQELNREAFANDLGLLSFQKKKKKSLWCPGVLEKSAQRKTGPETGRLGREGIVKGPVAAVE